MIDLNFSCFPSLDTFYFHLLSIALFLKSFLFNVVMHYVGSIHGIWFRSNADAHLLIYY